MFRNTHKLLSAAPWNLSPYLLSDHLLFDHGRACCTTGDTFLNPIRLQITRNTLMKLFHFIACTVIVSMSLMACNDSNHDTSIPPDDHPGDEPNLPPNDDTNDDNEPETGDCLENQVPPVASHRLTISELQQTEARLTNCPLMADVKASIVTLDNDQVESIQPLSPNNPDNVKRVESIVTEEDWEYLFPTVMFQYSSSESAVITDGRSPEYTYRNFLKAVGKFPAFCGYYEEAHDSDALCRQSLSTMFAHFTQETGGHSNHWWVEEWRQGLVHVREMGWTEEMRGGYNAECHPDLWQGQTWPCGTFANGDFKSYFGRGAKQLSYNYNYGPFSEAIFGTVHTLLDNPERVADTWLNLASAIFFFVYPQPPKPSMLHVIDGRWTPNAYDTSHHLLPGFGITTHIINGGVECGGEEEHIQSKNRIQYYLEFSRYLSAEISANETLGCANMQQFSEQGAGALPIYWEQDWSWNPNTDDGLSYACQLVHYQTPFSALKDGDYIRCVKHHFQDLVIVP